MMKIESFIRRIILIVFFAVMILFLCGCGFENSSSLVAKKAILDLENVDLTTASIKLKGEWEFYWNQLLTPDDFLLHDAQRSQNYIDLPHSWNGYEWEGQRLSGDGYATFRLLLNLDEDDIGQRLALHMPTIFHAYKLWIDGELYAEVGQVGTDRDSTIPSLATRKVYFTPEQKQVEIVMQVANFHHKRGGITKYIELGSSDFITTKVDRKIVFETFVTGSLFIIGSYHLLLFIHRRKDKAPLYFGLFAMMWGFRSLLVGEVMLTKWFPNFPWELQIKIEYLVLYLVTYIFLMYFYHLFKGIPRWFQKTSYVLAVFFSLVVMLTPARMYTHTLLLYELIIVAHIAFILYALYKSVKEKKEGALLFFIVSSISSLAVLNDFFYYNEWLLLGNSGTWGLFIFTCAQMYLLSYRSAKAIENEEKAAQELSYANNQLQEINLNLEKMVMERTSELAAANDRLQQAYDQLLRSEEGRKKLLSYITHDLRSPLSNILGYVEAMQDNIKPEKTATYLNHVYEKALLLNRMIDDLSFLSHLETNQIPFEMKVLSTEGYIRELWKRYEWVIMDAGIQGVLNIDLPKDVLTIYVNADPWRLEQALSNLISNAIKFTPQGGTITLSLSCQEWNGCQYALIEVKDTGIGIQPENLELIFQRHFKHYPGEYTKAAKGSGLGLAIAKEIVEAHKGKIWAESTGETGSSFYIALPVMLNS